MKNGGISEWVKILAPFVIWVLGVGWWLRGFAMRLDYLEEAGRVRESRIATCEEFSQWMRQDHALFLQEFKHHIESDKK